MSYVLCVTGSREATDPALVGDYLDWIVGHRGRPSRVLHGGAPGADSLASRWAYERMIDLEIVGALWGTHGRSAGPIRNQVMASKLMVGDILAAFPLVGKRRGTDDMITRVSRDGRATIYELPWCRD